MPDKKMIPAMFAGMFCLVFVLITLFLPDKLESEEENRQLVTDTGLTSYSLLDKSHIDQLERYFSDQFFGSTIFKKADRSLRVMLGTQIVNDVIVLSDQLIATESTVNSLMAQNNTSAVNSFAEKYGEQANIYVSLIPTALELYFDRTQNLPDTLSQLTVISDIYGEQSYSASNNLSSGTAESEYGSLDRVQVIDTHTSMMASKNQTLYYTTDTNLTSYGAHNIYSSIMTKLGYMPYGREDFYIEHAIYGYYGDLYRKTLLKRGEGDIIDLYQYTGSNTINGVEQYQGSMSSASESIFFREYMDQRQKTDVFLGEDCGVTHITTPSDTGEQLLIFSDSIAKPMMQFFPLHYDKVTFVNLRYFIEEQSKLIRMEEYDTVLFLYTVPAYVSDNSIATKLPLLYGEGNKES